MFIAGEISDWKLEGQHGISRIGANTNEREVSIQSYQRIICKRQAAKALVNVKTLAQRA